MEEKMILAYASQYKEKYFFNEEVGKLPQTVRNEVLMCLIMIVEEAGGVAELGFYPDKKTSCIKYSGGMLFANDLPENFSSLRFEKDRYVQSFSKNILFCFVEFILCQ